MFQYKNLRKRYCGDTPEIGPFDDNLKPSRLISFRQVVGSTLSAIEEDEKEVYDVN